MEINRYLLTVFIGLSTILSAAPQSGPFEKIPAYVRHVPHPGFWIKDSDGVCATQSWDDCMLWQKMWMFKNFHLSSKKKEAVLTDILYDHVWNFDISKGALRLDDPQNHRQTIEWLEKTYLHKDLSTMPLRAYHRMVKNLHRRLIAPDAYVKGYRVENENNIVSMLDGPNPQFDGDLIQWFAENDPDHLEVWTGLVSKVQTIGNIHLTPEQAAQVALGRYETLKSLGFLHEDEIDLINKYFYIPPAGEDVKAAMNVYFKELRRRLSDPSEDAFLTAAFAHQRLVQIHPFRCDGHGRTARLLMNLVLVQAGYDPVVFFSDRAYTKAVQAGDDTLFAELLRRESTYFAETAANQAVDCENGECEGVSSSALFADADSFELQTDAYDVIESQMTRQEELVDELLEEYATLR